MKGFMLIFSLTVGMLIMASAIASEDFYLYMHYDEQVSEHNYVQEPVDVYYRVTNVGEHNSNDLNMKIYIPDLDIYEVSRNFDLPKEDSYSGFMALDIPSNIPKGEYLVKFMVSNDNQKKVSYRYIIVG
jgi:hypothetical protein